MNDQEFKAGYEAAIEQYKRMMQGQGGGGQGGPGEKNNLPPLPTPPGMPKPKPQPGQQGGKGQGQGQKKQVDIGDRGNKAFQDKEQAEREKELAQEQGEDGEGEGGEQSGESTDGGGSLVNRNPNGTKGQAKADQYQGTGDLADRVKEIQRAFGDARLGNNLTNEVEVNKGKERIAQGARDAERYGRKGINRFKRHLDKFLKDASRNTRINSWASLNRKYDGTGIIAPGRRTARPKQDNIPKIYVYFDRSGSFDDAKTKDAADAVAMLNYYKRKGLIKFELFYFACTVNPDKTVCEAEGGTMGQPIMDHIEKHKPNNVIVMTDADIGDIRKGQVVPGTVWFLWKGGRSSNLSESLVGKTATKEFDI